MVRPSQRREVAQKAKEGYGISIKLACETFSISEVCYRYKRRLQNAYVERFNRMVRYDWLGQDIFTDIEEVQEKATTWLWHYNNERPNMALGGLTPSYFGRFSNPAVNCFAPKP